MRIFLVSLLLMVISSETPLQLNFNALEDGDDWVIVNDGVMGGLSQGRTVLTDSSLLYTGNISLRNNGGFSSLRSPFRRWDLSDYSEVSITYRSNGQPFAFLMETSRVWYEPKYRAYFASESDDWQTFTLPLLDFVETTVGRKTGRKIRPSQLSEIIRLGFINTGKYESDFELEIREIVFR